VKRGIALLRQKKKFGRNAKIFGENQVMAKTASLRVIIKEGV